MKFNFDISSVYDKSNETINNSYLNEHDARESLLDGPCTIYNVASKIQGVCFYSLLYMQLKPSRSLAVNYNNFNIQWCVAELFAGPAIINGISPFGRTRLHLILRLTVESTL